MFMEGFTLEILNTISVVCPISKVMGGKNASRVIFGDNLTVV
jgi:hypothetical protein